MSRTEHGLRRQRGKRWPGKEADAVGRIVRPAVCTRGVVLLIVLPVVGYLLLTAESDADPAAPAALEYLEAEGHAWSLAVDSDGRQLAWAEDEGAVRIWDRATDRVRLLLDGPIGAVRSVAFAPGGKVLALAGEKPMIRFIDPATGAEQTPAELRSTTARALPVAFSPDGRQFAMGSADEPKLLLWDRSARRLRSFSTGRAAFMTALAFSPDSRMIAFANSDGTLGVRDVADGAERFCLRAHPQIILGLAFSPDGRILASGGELDGSVRLYDSASGQPVAALPSDSSGITAVAFTADGSTLISAGRDRTIRVWSLPDGRLRATVRGETLAIWGLALFPDGRAATGGADRSVALWNLGPSLAARQ